MIEWDGIEESINTSKNPLLLMTYIFIHKDMITDENLCLVIRYVMKYHYYLFFKKDIRKLLYLLNGYELSKNVINDYYNNLIKQKELLNKFKKFKQAYNRRYFWCKSNKEQIEYLERLRDKFYSYNDCCIGNLHFHKKIKIKLDLNYKSRIINENEIFNRLKLTYDLFGQSFFLVYNINLMSYEDFSDISYLLKCKFSEYIFIQINNIIDELINDFTLYDCIVEQMHQLVNPKPLEIEMDIFTSELDDCDF